MKNKDKIKKLFNLCQHLRLDVQFTNNRELSYEPIKGYGYDAVLFCVNGDVQNILLQEEKDLAIQIARDICHEIGHYLVSPKQRRRRKDFGIPTNRMSRRSKEKYDIEEVKAQVIQYYILTRLGFKAYKNDIVTEDFFDDKTWWNKSGKIMVDTVLDLAK